MAGGRPTTYTQKIGIRLCELIANGKSVPAACKQMNLSFGTVMQWSTENEKFAELYAQAREWRTELLMEELQEISDNGNTPAKGKKGSRPLHDNVERARLRVDTRKWIIVKMLPKKYSDKVDHSVKASINVSFDKTDEAA